MIILVNPALIKYDIIGLYSVLQACLAWRKYYQVPACTIQNLSHEHLIKCKGKVAPVLQLSTRPWRHIGGVEV